MTWEEVLTIVYRTILRTREVVSVECRDLKHLASPLCITSRDQWGMHVEVATFMEEGMDRHRHVVAHAVDRSEGVRTGA